MKFISKYFKKGDFLDCSCMRILNKALVLAFGSLGGMILTVLKTWSLNLSFIYLR